MFFQETLSLQRRDRGCHQITPEIVSLLSRFPRVEKGMMHLFLQHTSASLTISENADPDVMKDLEMAGSRIAPEDFPYRHTCEGPDDMPAHVKSAMFGWDLHIPVTDGRLALGTWQGVCLWEHRDRAGPRKIVCSLYGE